MKNPILIIESHDISIYPTVEQAVTDLELSDIVDGIYEVYDSDGNLLDFSTDSVDEEKRLFGWKWTKDRKRVHLKEHYPTKNYSEELREKLTYYLFFKGIKREDIEGLTLEELIRRVSHYMPWKI